MKKQKNATILKMPKRLLTPAHHIESRVLFLRHRRVILDVDIAQLYGVPAKRLNEQVKRNQERFPADFMFQLTEKEHDSLRSQIATSNKRRGGRRYLPYAFTEHGAINGGNRAQLRSSCSDECFCGACVRAIARDARHESATCRKD
jgi:hypothetical protein